MAAARSDAQENRLLAALGEHELEDWLPDLCTVSLAAGQVLHGSARANRFAYFPLDCVVSLLVQVDDGFCDEVSVVGREGVVDVSLFSGEGSSIQAVVQSPGLALRMDAAAFKAGFERSAVVARLLLSFVLAQNVQISQSVACSHHHSIEQRLCRRLLQGLDLQRGSRFLATHEQLGLMLGVRRESVTVEARKLQAARAIRYSRGRITVLDRAELERRACECFAVVKKGCERLEARAPQPLPQLKAGSPPFSRPLPGLGRVPAEAASGA